MTDQPTQSKFEEDLKVYFPEIYKLHQMAKYDAFLWDAVYKMLEMADKNAYGEIRVTYQNGKINHVFHTVQYVSQTK
jgi:hypothetical protein